MSNSHALLTINIKVYSNKALYAEISMFLFSLPEICDFKFAE